MQEDDFLKLGYKIKYERAKRNISQLDLSLRTGLTTRTISRIECGCIDAKFSTLTKIANALDIDKSYFSKVERGLANPTVTYLRDLAKYFGIKFTDLTDENFEPQKIMFN